MYMVDPWICAWRSTASFGFLVHGPTGHYFYGMLDKQLPGTAMKTVSAPLKFYTETAFVCLLERRHSIPSFPLLSRPVH